MGAGEARVISYYKLVIWGEIGAGGWVLGEGFWGKLFQVVADACLEQEKTGARRARAASGGGSRRSRGEVRGKMKCETGNLKCFRRLEMKRFEKEYLAPGQGSRRERSECRRAAAAAAFPKTSGMREFSRGANGGGARGTALSRGTHERRVWQGRTVWFPPAGRRIEIRLRVGTGAPLE